MRVSIVCSDTRHPVVPRLKDWSETMIRQGHAVSLVGDLRELADGDILFLVSCSQMITPATRDRFRATLVLHASDLPNGRGWSPHVWAILGGATEITVCLLEAAEPVDSGPVWLRGTFHLQGHELLPEINQKLFDVELQLMTQAVENFDGISPRPQTGEPGPYLRKRGPADSQLDPGKTLAEQFDLLRVVDAIRHPAYFEYRGHRYILNIEKAK